MPSSRWERVRARAAAWNRERAQHGARAATVHGLRRLLDLGPVTSGRVDQMSEQIQGLIGRAEHLDRFSHGVADGAARDAVTARETTVALVGSERAARELFEQVWATTAWLESVDVPAGPLVSVVLPTRGNRPVELRRAVESVRAQRYGHWQLVVVVDGGDATVDAVRASIPDDERIELVRSAGTGVSAARNTGLDAVRGDFVAYLDDDNIMAPLWTRAIAWASERFPEAEVFYGAEVVDDPGERGTPGSTPQLHIAPFDRRRLVRGNYIDQNTVAYRRTLSEAHYDESLDANVDWDFLLRVTARREPRMLPVVASHYTTSSPGRLTGSPAATASWSVVSARARATVPLRVLALNLLHPLVTETYVDEDLGVLAAHGADVACCVLRKRAAPSRIPYPLYHDFAQACAEHEPDVVLVHWAGFARDIQSLLHEHGVPYAVRAHSFSAEVEAMRELLDDPLCVGVWCFAEQAIDHPRAHVLPVVFRAAEQMPPPAAQRDLVLSVSAGLPKKDFPFLVDVLAGLPGVDRRIVLGATAGHEQVIVDLLQAVQELDDPPLVQMNLTREQVFGLLARASAVVYTLTADSGFGCPMAMVEAMTAGACVLLPERDEVHRVFGPDARTYGSREDLVDQIRTILAGGREIDAERARVQEWARDHFCDPEVAKRFAAELADAVADHPPVS